MVGNLADIITCAKFQDDILKGYNVTGGGSRIFHFPIDFCMGLTTVQRDCAACDVFRRTLNLAQRTDFRQSLSFALPL